MKIKNDYHWLFPTKLLTWKDWYRGSIQEFHCLAAVAGTNLQDIHVFKITFINLSVSLSVSPSVSVSLLAPMALSPNKQSLGTQCCSTGE